MTSALVWQPCSRGFFKWATKISFSSAAICHLFRCTFSTEAYAFLEASKKRVVLGPSRDGGYYLVGCNQPTPEIFQGMSWSHSEVLTETQNKLASLKVDYHLLPLWFDIDTADDLRHLESVLDNALKKAMPNTLLLLQRLGLKK